MAILSMILRDDAPAMTAFLSERPALAHEPIKVRRLRADRGVAPVVACIVGHKRHCLEALVCEFGALEHLSDEGLRASGGHRLTPMEVAAITNSGVFLDVLLMRRCGGGSGALYSAIVTSRALEYAYAFGHVKFARRCYVHLGGHALRGGRQVQFAAVVPYPVTRGSGRRHAGGAIQLTNEAREALQQSVGALCSEFNARPDNACHICLPTFVHTSAGDAWAHVTPRLLRLDPSSSAPAVLLRTIKFFYIRTTDDGAMQSGVASVSLHLLCHDGKKGASRVFEILEKSHFTALRAHTVGSAFHEGAGLKAPLEPIEGNLILSEEGGRSPVLYTPEEVVDALQAAYSMRFTWSRQYAIHLAAWALDLLVWFQKDPVLAVRIMGGDDDVASRVASAAVSMAKCLDDTATGEAWGDGCVDYGSLSAYHRALEGASQEIREKEHAYGEKCRKAGKLGRCTEAMRLSARRLASWARQTYDMLRGAALKLMSPQEITKSMAWAFVYRAVEVLGLAAKNGMSQPQEVANLMMGNTVPMAVGSALLGFGYALTGWVTVPATAGLYLASTSYLATKGKIQADAMKLGETGQAVCDLLTGVPAISMWFTFLKEFVVGYLEMLVGSISRLSRLAARSAIAGAAFSATALAGLGVAAGAALSFMSILTATIVPKFIGVMISFFRDTPEADWESIGDDWERILDQEGEDGLFAFIQKNAPQMLSHVTLAMVLQQCGNTFCTMVVSLIRAGLGATLQGSGFLGAGLDVFNAIIDPGSLLRGPAASALAWLQSDGTTGATNLTSAVGKVFAALGITIPGAGSIVGMVIVVLQLGVVAARVMSVAIPTDEMRRAIAELRRLRGDGRGGALFATVSATQLGNLKANALKKAVVSEARGRAAVKAVQQYVGDGLPFGRLRKDLGALPAILTALQKWVHEKCPDPECSDAEDEPSCDPNQVGNLEILLKNVDLRNLLPDEERTPHARKETGSTPPRRSKRRQASDPEVD